MSEGKKEKLASESNRDRERAREREGGDLVEKGKSSTKESVEELARSRPGQQQQEEEKEARAAAAVEEKTGEVGRVDWFSFAFSSSNG